MPVRVGVVGTGPVLTAPHVQSYAVATPDVHHHLGESVGMDVGTCSYVRQPCTVPEQGGQRRVQLIRIVAQCLGGQLQVGKVWPRRAMLETCG